MSCNSLLRIGPSSDNATGAVIRDALVAYFESESSEPTAVVVTNKYFSASVLLEDLGSEKQGKEDGIILVFNAASSSNSGVLGSSCPSFDLLNQVHEEAEKLKQCGELLRLCVGVFVGESETQELRGEKHEEEYSRRVLWCLDRGYEYVEADMSLEGQQSGHDEREKDGFARIVEAVAGTMWSSAVMKSTKNTNMIRSLGEGVQGGSNAASNSSSKFDIEQDKLVAMHAAGHSSNEAADENEVEDAKDSHYGNPNEAEDGGVEQEHVEALDNLERLIGEAKRIRESSRSGKLSDDNRRKRAGDAAMLMMGLMDQLNLSDSASDDGSMGASVKEAENNLF